MLDITQVVPDPSPDLDMTVSDDGAKFQIHLLHPLHTSLQRFQLHVVAVSHFIFLESKF